MSEPDATVLIIDDEEAVRRPMAMYLVARGFRVLEAVDGRSGVEAFRREQPQLVLVDLRMPEMDGLGVIEVLSREAARTPVIVVSGTGRIEDAVEALHRGAWDYVVKPIEDMAVLLHAIRRALERALLIRENEFYREHLEQQVRQRTVELETVNQSLAAEIDVRRQAEAQLRESEQRFRAVIEQAADGFCLHAMDGQILDVNQRTCDTLGYSREELLSMGIRDVEMMYDRLIYMEGLKAQLVSGEPVTLEGLHRRKDGTTFPVEIRARQLELGGQLCMVALARDVTERKRAEEALQKSEALLRETQAITKVGGWEYDVATGSIAWTDEVRHLYGVGPGFDPNDVAEDTSFYAPEAAPVVRHAFERALSHAEPYDLSVEFIRANGERIWVRTMGRPEVQDGKVVRISGNFMDITERKQAEAALAQYRQHLEELVDERTRDLKAAQEELLRKERLASLGQVIATVAHEIRNPLATIRTSVFTVDERVRGKGLDVERSLDRVERSIARCDGIIEELLDYTRAHGLRRAVTRIDEWLERVLDEYPVPGGIKIDRCLAADVEMSIDRERFRRCVINLLDNAWQSLADVAEDRNEIIVESGVVDDRLQVRVMDRGAGVSPGTMPRIFEPLFSTKGFGVGLGLPFVKQVMEQHGGGVEIENRPGGGVVATLWFPLALTAPAE